MKSITPLLAYTCILSLLFNSTAYSQANCNNVDFEDGAFTNWQAFYGDPPNGCCDGNGDPMIPTPGFIAGRHEIMTGAGTDPIVPQIPVVSPFGGTYSVRLGNSGVGYQAEKLTYQLVVTAQNPNFTYHYAIIVQDGGHPDDDQPKFSVQVLSQGQTVSCGEYNVTAGGNIPGFQNGPGDVKYKNWSMVAVDLTPYIGQTLTIEFRTNDCGQGGHYGYAYIDASCNPMQITSSYCPGDPAATLTAPAGFQSYQWSTGQNTQSITVSNPTPGNTISVVCAPVQGSNCSSTLQYTFLQNPPVNANFVIDSSCGQGAVLLTDSSTIVANNAQITAWQWLINDQVVSTSPSFTYGFPGPGDYEVTIIAESNGGCPDTTTRIVSIPQGLDAITAYPPNSTFNGFGVSCPGASDGSATVSATYGSQPYTYLWSNPQASTTQTVNNLGEGTFTVTVTEAGGCEVVDTVVISAPPPIVIAPVGQNIVCFGENTGSIALNATGGVPPLAYAWQHDPALTTPTASNLAANTYTFTVSDANGCTLNSSVDSSIVLTQPVSGYSLGGTVVNTTCFSGCDGSITLGTVSGNTAPYSYAWSTTPQQTTPTATGLCAGTYTVTVTDANGCSGTISFTVTEPAQLQTNITKTDLLCFNDNSGTTTVDPSGGTIPYSYIWSDPNNSTTATVTGLAMGPYSVTVYDNLQCSVTATISLTQPTVLQVTATHQDVACNGGNTGKVFSVAQGGTPPYLYQWSTAPVQTQATAENLIAGPYTVTVTDDNNCTVSVSETVNEPTLLTATISNSVDNICFDGSTGTATVTAGGGSLPYLYNWDTNPVQNTATATALRVGTYNVTVTDDSLCTATAQVVISQPTRITIVPTVLPALCYDSTQGSITLAVTEGTPGYTYNWSPGGPGTETLANLLAGTYNVTVTDANNCFEERSYVITQPTQLSIATDRDNASCYGYSDGRIRIIANGGTPTYTYSIWENGAQLATNTNGTFNGLPLGNYVAQYADANSCIINTPVSVLQPTELLVASISADSVNCYGYSDGSISILGTGSVQPYTYSINGTLVNTDGQFMGLTQGSYNVLITDSHNCTVSTIAIVNEPYLHVVNASPDSLGLKLGDTKPVVITSNYDPNTVYNWSTWQGLDCQDCPNVNVTLYENYTYTITVTAHPHDLDCIATIDVPVTVIPNYDVFIPNAFTPNGDGNNDYFAFYGNKPAIKQMQVQIFNRIGEKVYDSNDLEFKWDGYYKGILQNPGVYVYTMNLVFFDNHVENGYKGTVTLIR